MKPEGPGETHGIDEAGYGPLLGPLVVARTDFAREGPGGLRRVGRRVKRVRVGDSKRILAGAGGFATLETTVLGFHAALHGRPPATVREWLANDTVADTVEALERLPWYRRLEEALPFTADPGEVDRAARDVSDGKVLRGGRICGLRVRVLDEVTLNRELARTENKHECLFEEVVRLIEEPFDRATRHHFEVDRLGGRTRYGDKLAMAFPFTPITVIGEAPKRSSYEIERDRAFARVSFSVAADDRHPETALASMCAKYTREILMRVFNDHWRRRAPDLRPTAGYYEDGRRFLADLERRELVRSGDRERLVRNR